MFTTYQPQDFLTIHCRDISNLFINSSSVLNSGPGHVAHVHPQDPLRAVQHLHVHLVGVRDPIVGNHVSPQKKT